jgi:hypothetical protein
MKMMTFEETVTVYPIAVTEQKFWDATRVDDDIEVGHMIDADADHRRKLRSHEMKNLRRNEHFLRKSERRG